MEKNKYKHYEIYCKWDRDRHVCGVLELRYFVDQRVSSSNNNDILSLIERYGAVRCAAAVSIISASSIQIRQSEYVFLHFVMYSQPPRSLPLFFIYLFCLDRHFLNVAYLLYIGCEEYLYQDQKEMKCGRKYYYG